MNVYITVSTSLQRYLLDSILGNLSHDFNFDLGFVLFRTPETVVNLKNLLFYISRIRN